MRPSRIVQAVFALAIGTVRCAPSQRAEPAHTVPVPRAPATMAAALAQAGYIAIPFRWAPSGHQFVDTKIDTTSITLSLDSGFNGDLLLDPAFAGASGVRTADVTAMIATAYGTQSQSLAFVDRIAFGSLVLKSLEVVMTSPSSAGGYLGMGVLNTQAAIIDFATDTLYLLVNPTEQRPVSRHAAIQNATGQNLRGVLEAAGQYRTFLSLMQEAGLMSLLEGTVEPIATPDSLAWIGFRTQAIQQSGSGTIPDGRERILKTRQALNQRLRQTGQLTVFVPTDAAFAQLAPGTLRALRSDQAQLARVLRVHLLRGTRLDTLALRTLIRGVSQPDGPTLGFYAMGPRLDVDRLTRWEGGALLGRATIVESDLAAVNGIAQGIDRVLLPPPIAMLPGSMLKSQGYIAVPLYRIQNGYYMVRATIDSTPLTLLIDTGAPPELVISDQTFERLRVQGDRVSLTFDSVTTVAVGVVSANLTHVNKKLQDYDILPIDGILGGELLHKYHAYLDYATGTLYLRFPTAATVPAPARPAQHP